MLVIGNGESRSSINVNKILDIKIGCNAIYRDYKVEHLVCADKRMVNEAILDSTNISTLIYTRKDWYDNYRGFLHVRTVPELPYKGKDRWDKPFNWGSGPYAVLIAAELSEEVKLLGFDLYSKTDKINNVYKGTDNYDSADKRAIDPRYWIHQIGMVFRCFPQTEFTIYQEKDWEMPKAWIQPHVRLDNISNIYYNT